MTEIFECVCCGECCRGTGGIVLRQNDSERLAAFFGLDVNTFHARFAEEKQGKHRIVSGKDGSCVFFEQNSRCGVHGAKPDVCRAWPFFRGNLVDPVSLAMAGEGCPGIARGVSFTDFVAKGAQYLLKWGLYVAEKETGTPHALMSAVAIQRMATISGIPYPVHKEGGGDNDA